MSQNFYFHNQRLSQADACLFRNDCSTCFVTEEFRPCYQQWADVPELSISTKLHWYNNIYIYENFFTWWLRQMNLSECFKGLCNTSTVAPIRGVGWICSDKTGTPNIFVITWHKHGRRKACGKSMIDHKTVTVLMKIEVFL